MIDKTQSQTIDLLRFPLAVFVVFIHATSTLQLVPINEADFPLLSGTGIYNVIEISLQLTLTHIAVPTFFLISGFLFFQKLEVWNWSIYGKKLITRNKTLLLPYFCWITISYLCIAGIPAVKTLIDGGTWNEAWEAFMGKRFSLIGCYWGIESIYQFPDWFGNEVSAYSNPIVPTLWFVRNLMVVTILSPLFYFFVRKTKICGLLLIVLCYMSNHAFDMTSVLYYATGAFLAINNKSIVTVAKRIRVPAMTIAVISLIACTYCAGRFSLYGFRLYPVYVLSGVWSAVYMSSYLVEKKHLKPNRFLVQSCFFVYALHYMRITEELSESSLISYSYKVMAELLLGTPHVELLQYILPPVITILICLGLFWLLQKFAPRLCALLTGNRG